MNKEQGRRIKVELYKEEVEGCFFRVTTGDYKEIGDTFKKINSEKVTLVHSHLPPPLLA